jgi:diguanylate cyclase (GGDEF)-like protein/PAS domain S-box-containing protein
LHGSLEGIVLNARASRWILEASDSFCALSGYEREELVGRTSTEIGLIEFDEARIEATGRADRGLEGFYETRLRRRDGEWRWVEFSHQLLGSEYVLTIVRDVTERKRVEEGLRHQAHTDPLTGIYNRRRFEQEVERQLRESERFGDSVTLVVLDLDEFKAINDGYGHQAGDEVLRAVAGALRQAVRQTDVVGRIGGDEFAALLTRANPGGAERVVKDFRRLLEAVNVGSAEEGTRVHASIGIATAHGPERDYASLLREADRAMYAQKKT